MNANECHRYSGRLSYVFCQIIHASKRFKGTQAGGIVPDDARHFALFDSERNIFQRPGGLANKEQRIGSWRIGEVQNPEWASINPSHAK
jgi:hypothetical protein